MVRRFFVLAVLSASTSLAALTGCGGSVADKPAEVASSNQAITTTSEHGPMKALANALGSVQLTDAQRTTIQGMFAEADVRHTAAKTQSQGARADLLNALAAQVEQGKVDRAALAPKEQALEATWNNTRAADRAALEKLHDMLDAGQRAALVAALEQQKGDSDGGKHGHKHAGHERMAKMAEDLKLTDDQKAKIGEAMRAERGQAQAQHQGHANMEAILTAFKSDHFKMDEVAPMTADRDPIARHLRMAEITVPLLTPEQRMILAGKIRAKAQGQNGD